MGERVMYIRNRDNCDTGHRGSCLTLHDDIKFEHTHASCGFTMIYMYVNARREYN